MAKLCRFYGLKPWEYDQLDIKTEGVLWQSITRIEAQDALTQLRIASFTNLKPAAAQKLERRWFDLAYPVEERIKAGKQHLSDLVKSAKKRE